MHMTAQDNRTVYLVGAASSSLREIGQAVGGDVVRPAIRDSGVFRDYRRSEGRAIAAEAHHG